MPVDLTSPWIPLSIIMLLGIFMVYQFIQERKVSRALELEEASAASVAQPDPEPTAVPAPVTTPAEAETPAQTSPQKVAAVSEPVEKPAKKKMKLRWRTAWIWLPFLIGFFGQAYLSFIQPMLDNAG